MKILLDECVSRKEELMPEFESQVDSFEKRNAYLIQKE